MARPRKPTKTLELIGAFKKDPQRKRERENEPVPTGALGDPPAHFDEALKAIWVELAGIVPPGVATNADRWMFEMACVLMFRFRSAPLEMPAPDFSQFRACLSAMGLTPADRSKIVVPKQEKPENRFTKIAAQAKGGAVVAWPEK